MSYLLFFWYMIQPNNYEGALLIWYKFWVGRCHFSCFSQNKRKLRGKLPCRAVYMNLWIVRYWYFRAGAVSLPCLCRVSWYGFSPLTGNSYWRNSWSKRAEWRPLTVHPKVPTAKHFSVVVQKSKTCRVVQPPAGPESTQRRPDRKAIPFTSMSSGCLIVLNPNLMFSNQKFFYVY